jgi:hypothetical protein
MRPNLLLHYHRTDCHMVSRMGWQTFSKL